MKLLVILPFLLTAACAVERDASRVSYHPHEIKELRTTPGGHRRDAGPFESVAKGYVTEQEIDQAVDGAFARFAQVFPELTGKLKNVPVAINDDYAMWVPEARAFASGADRAGAEVVNVCLWSRGESPVEPGDAFIRRHPGLYFGVNYSGWRWTTKPLLPALLHELLHTAIEDHKHKDHRWKTADQPY